MSDEPIFILCSARSGSTLLRRVLDAHPAIASPPEVNILSSFESIHFASTVVTTDEGLSD